MLLLGNFAGCVVNKFSLLFLQTTSPIEYAFRRTRTVCSLEVSWDCSCIGPLPNNTTNVGNATKSSGL